MALEIHFAPVLYGDTAQRFVEEAENRKPTRGPLTCEEKSLLEDVMRRGKEFKLQLEKEYGVRL